MTLAATTVARGGIALYLDGIPASNINDYPMHPVGTLVRRFYLFSYASHGRVTLELRAEPRWAGKIDSLSLRQVVREAPYDFFSVAADRRDFANLLGIKFGRFLAGNIAIGDRTTQALLSPKAAWNIALGARANASTIDGFENTAVGCFTLEFNQVSRNSAFGYSALRSNLTGEQNTGCGYKAFVSNTTGGNNSGLGFHAALYNRDGSNNTVIGTLAGYYNESGGYNTIVGSQAGLNAGGDGNVYVGALTGPLHVGEYRFPYANQVCVGVEASSYGNSTVALGRLARCGVDPTLPGGYEITTTATALGHEAVATQDSSVAVGGYASATAVRTVAVGESASAGDPNAAALGYLAAARERCAAIGAQANVNLVGAGNSGLGYGANAHAQPTTRADTTALGAGALTTGDHQVQLGGAGTTPYAFAALQLRSDARDKADVRPTSLGLAFVEQLRPVEYRLDLREDYRDPLPPPFPEPRPVAPIAPLAPPAPPAGTPHDTPEGAAAWAAYEAAARAFALAQAAYESEAAAHAAALAAWQARADAYAREEGERWAERNGYAALAARRDGSRKRTRLHQGLIAQDLAALIASGAIPDFAGLQHHQRAGGEDVYSIGYQELIGPLIRAVQQLAEQARALAARVAVLEARGG